MLPRFARAGSLTLVLVALAVSSCHLARINLWQPAAPCAVSKVEDIDYCDGSCDFRHHLDLLVPQHRTNYPVIVLVHGGAWILGNNRCCGLYSSVGQYLASRGIGVVLPNYRLSPNVAHPEHVKDIARAVAWTRAHIAEHGGDPANIFLLGHSAGGHLVALLGTDERYLKAEGLGLDDLRGVIGVSGVYNIPAGNVDAKLGGSAPQAFRLDEIFPVRGGKDSVGKGRDWAGIPLHINVYHQAFGDDPDVRADASPIAHVHTGLPPFLLVNAENDLPTLADMANDFQAALSEQGIEVRHLTVPHRNHNSVFFYAMEPTDPLARTIEQFVESHRSQAGR